MHSRTPSRLILAENLNRLMLSTLSLNSNTKLVKRSGLGLGTMGRVRNAEAAATIDTLDRFAKCFGVQSWELLVPLDLAQPTQVELPAVELQPEVKPPQTDTQPSARAHELGVLFDLLTARNGKVDQTKAFAEAVQAITRAVTGR